MELQKKYQVWYKSDNGYHIYFECDTLDEAVKLQVECAGNLASRDTLITKKPEMKITDSDEPK
jgi:hypothetical protein